MMQHDLQLHEPVTKPLGRSLWHRIERHRWFVLFVIAPSLLATIYYGFVASDLYVSEARFVIKSPDSKQTQLSGLASIMQTTGLSAGQEQTNEVIDYLKSRDALRELSRRAPVEASFTRPSADRFSRFPGIFQQPSFEGLYKHYLKMIDAHVDQDSGNAVLTVKAFTGPDAHLLNENLLQLSEGLVNRLNARASSRSIDEAQQRVRIAENRVRAARANLGKYRNSSELLDPAVQGKGVVEVSNALVAQRAALQAQMMTISRVAPANPSLPALRQQIGAISAQIDAQNSRATGNNSGIASKLSGYEALEAEQAFATQTLTASSAALEQARAEAQRQKFYLERVVQPNTPDEAILPARLKKILTIIGASLCLYLVGWMLIVGILEHAPED